MIKGVLFDKDGTLIELGHTWDEPSVKLLENLFEKHHIDETLQKEISKKIGINEEGTGIVPNSVFAAGSIYDQAVLLSEYINSSVEDLEDYIEDAYFTYVNEQEIQAKLVPGVHELLSDLKNDYVLGLITNDNVKLTMSILSQLGILEYFDFIGCADQYGPKPRPDALYEFARRFDIKLNEMVYVGDSSLDMEFGKNTAASIGYIEQSGNEEHLEEADYLVNNLMEVKEIIEEMNQIK